MSLPIWPRRWAALGTANYRQQLEDFQVDEVLGFEADGDGPHQLLLVEKRGANTAFVAQALARHAGVAERDVGYAGLKDRHAVTRQYFSVPGAGVDRSKLEANGVTVLSATPHRRKLRRGCHCGNRFRIVLREVQVEPAALQARLGEIAKLGVPNYFGVQRFGKDGANLRLAEALLAGRRLPRHKRGFAISTLRALHFNTLLGKRLSDGSWDQALSGELLQLDGRGSWFRYDPVDPAIAERLSRLEIHPTGALPGRARFELEGEVAELESALMATHPQWLSVLESLGVEADRRALRLVAHDLQAQWLDEQTVALQFELCSGGFATTVLGEMFELSDVHGQPEGEIE